MTPLAMPQNGVPSRYVRGRYTVLVRKWSDGTWKYETGERREAQVQCVHRGPDTGPHTR